MLTSVFSPSVNFYTQFTSGLCEILSTVFLRGLQLLIWGTIQQIFAL